MRQSVRCAAMRLLFGLVLGIAVFHGAAHGLSFELGWQVAGKGGFSAPNMVCDAAGKPLALVACEKGVGVVSLTLKGERQWAYAMTPPVTSSPAVADVDGDGAEEIVAADSAGRVAVLRSQDGAVLWTAQLAGGTAASAPTATDLDGDGHLEVLVGDRSGALYCLDNAGKLRWSFSGDGGQTGPVLVADVYDLPGKEIFMPSHDRCIYALSARGERLWDLSFPADLFPNSNPFLADVDGDKVPELYVGGGLNHFYRIDLATAAVAFEQNVYMHINGAMTATDLDGDGADEVVFGTKAGAAYLYGKDGMRWTRPAPQASFQSTPLMLALDDGTRMAALLFGIEGCAFAYDAAGNTIAKVAGLPCKPEMSGPLAGDIDGDGQTEAVITSASTADGAPGVFCLKLGIPYREDARNRLVFGQDRAHSGRPRGATSYPPLPVPVHKDASVSGERAEAKTVGEALLLSGPNTWRYDVENPSRQRLVLQLELRAPDGVMWRFARHVTEAKDRVVVKFPIETPGTYAVTRQLADADRRERVSSEEETLTFAGIDSDTAYLEKLFGSMETVTSAWRETNAACANGMRQQLAALRGTLAELRSKETPDRVARLAVLREDAVRLEAMASAGQALAPTGSFAAWAFCPWAYFDPRDTLPSTDRKTDALEVSLCAAEYGSLALNVTNLTPRSIDVRTLCDGLEQVGAPGKVIPGSFITFRRAVVVPTQNRERVADALPELDEAGALSVASFETQQLWITVNAGSLAPGEYVAGLRLKSVEPDPTERKLPIRITIHDLTPPRPRPLNLCNWVSYSGELASGNDAVLKDLIEHGETVFLATPPKAVCNADGQLEGPLDFTAHDEIVKRLSPHGLLLFLSPQGGLTGQPFLSEPWKKGFVLFLRAWVKHLTEMGVGCDKWALYPYDEPSSPYGETARNLVEVAKVAREADPAIQIYTDPTSGTTMESIAMFKGLIDIWQPSDELLERLGPEMLPVIKRDGKQVWFYEAAGNSKTLSCLGKYLWRFWYAWKEDFTGVGWWVYSQHGPDRWDGPNPVGDYWATVYDGPRGPVTSKRWEATREGVQDYEHLYLLRAAIRDAEQRGVPAPKVDPAKKLLSELPKEIEAVLLHTGRRLPLTPDSVPAYEQTTRTLADARARIIDACLQLKALSTQSVPDVKK